MEIEGKAIKFDEEKLIREFPSGAVRDLDNNKENYIESIPWLALRRYAFYMKSKESKYGKGNFKKGIPIESYEESLMRHIQKYISNKYENGNFEKEEDHLSAILFNIFGMMFEEERDLNIENNNR